MPCHLSRKGEALARALLVLPRALPLGGAVERSETERVLPKATLSVTAMPCHLSRKGEALARAKSLWFTGQLLLTLSVTAMPCHLSRKGEALARAKSLWFTGQLLLPSLSSSCPGGERPPSAGDKKGKGFGNPPVTARSVLSRSQRACPMRKKIGWRGFASRVKSFFRFLFSRKKERELPFS